MYRAYLRFWVCSFKELLRTGTGRYIRLVVIFSGCVLLVCLVVVFRLWCGRMFTLRARGRRFSWRSCISSLDGIFYKYFSFFILVLLVNVYV